MGGGFAVEALLIVMALAAVGLLIRYIVELCGVFKLRADNKAGRLLKIKAVVTRSVRAGRGSGSSRAYAEYAVGERKIKGRMICASAVYLTEGQTVKVLVSERKPGFFAVDERQIGGAVFDNALMCIMFLIIAGFLIFVAVDRIAFG
ncbi:MAG: hypothetical protein K2N56_02510 [Oscillospiraceae bacterium]|nr:hypothetical protein [Oscillospiraceae bacterium]